jgi:hypothetical protein
MATNEKTKRWRDHVPCLLRPSTPGYAPNAIRYPIGEANCLIGVIASCMNRSRAPVGVQFVTPAVP